MIAGNARYFRRFQTKKSGAVGKKCRKSLSNRVLIYIPSLIKYNKYSIWLSYLPLIGPSTYNLLALILPCHASRLFWLLAPIIAKLPLDYHYPD